MDNRSYVVTNSIKTLKMVHMKENLKKKKKKENIAGFENGGRGHEPRNAGSL